MDPSWDWRCFWRHRSVELFLSWFHQILGMSRECFAPRCLARLINNRCSWHVSCVLKSMPKKEGYDIYPKGLRSIPLRAIRFWSRPGHSCIHLLWWMCTGYSFMDHCKIFKCNNRWISSMLTLAWVKLNQLKTGRSDGVGTDPQINGLVEEHIYRNHGV